MVGLLAYHYQVFSLRIMKRTLSMIAAGILTLSALSSSAQTMFDEIQLVNGSGTMTLQAPATGTNTFTFPATSGMVLVNPMTANGQILYGGSGDGTATSLAAGSVNSLLQSNGAAAPSWVSALTLTGLTLSSGKIALPATTLANGQITLAGARFMHAFNGTFLGTNAGSLSSSGGGNVAIGTSAGTALTTAVLNVAVGDLALQSTTTGNNNIAIGYAALRFITTASDNTAVGIGALEDNTTGDNTAFGAFALTNSTTGQYNTALGRNASYANLTGVRNTTVGYYAGINATSDDNTSVGYLSLNALSTGTQNTAIGSGANVATGAQTNSTAIGYGAIAPSSNSIKLGNDAVTLVTTTGSLSAGGLNVAASTALTNLPTANFAVMTMNSTGTTANNFGGVLQFQLEKTDGSLSNAGAILNRWTDAANGESEMLIGPSGVTGFNVYNLLLSSNSNVTVGAGAGSLIVNSAGGNDLTVSETAVTRSGNIAINPGASNSVTSNGKLSVTGAVTIGGGTPITGILASSTTTDLSSIGNGTETDVQITVTGAAVGDVVAIGMPDGVFNTNDVVVRAWVSAADTVTIRIANNSGSSIDPGSETYRAMVYKF
jgi:hypothetical protein